MLQQIVGVELQVLAAVAGPLTMALAAWLVRQLQALVRWAEQAIPDKSERYVQVAGLLSQRFPGLPSSDVEVLIESEVHALKQGLVPAAEAAAPALGLPTSGPVVVPLAPAAPYPPAGVTAAAPVSVVGGGG